MRRPGAVRGPEPSDRAYTIQVGDGGYPGFNGKRCCCCRNADHAASEHADMSELRMLSQVLCRVSGTTRTPSAQAQHLEQQQPVAAGRQGEGALQAAEHPDGRLEQVHQPVLQ